MGISTLFDAPVAVVPTTATSTLFDAPVAVVPTTATSTLFDAPLSIIPASSISTLFDEPLSFIEVDTFRPLIKESSRSSKKELADNETANLSNIIRETQGVGNLYGRTDINTTSLDFASGSSITSIELGNASTLTTFTKDLVILGQINISGDVFKINDGVSTIRNQAIIIERGSTGDDAVVQWEESSQTLEFGLFNTNSGSTIPTSNLSNYIPLRAGNISMAGDQITSSNSMTLSSSASTQVGLNSRSSGMAINQFGDTSLDNSFTATSLIGAMNEIKLNGPNSVPYLVNEYANQEAFSITEGQIVYISGIISGVSRVSLASASSSSVSNNSIGAVRATIVSTSLGDILSEGVFNVRFEQSLVLADGDEIFLSPNESGSATNITPSTSGQVIRSLGIIKDSSSYDGNTNLLAEVEFATSSPTTVVP